MAKKKKKRISKRRLLRLMIAAALITVVVSLCSLLLLRREYKLEYRDIIGETAAEYGIDPYLVIAVIYCESSFRESVVSPKGAVGLMQIMPDTGAWIAGKLDYEPFEPEMLRLPDVNIRMGCWYLRFLLDRYDDCIENAVAAYNAGHGNVDSWLDDPQYSADGRLTSIPFRQTEEYVGKVVTVCERYRALYHGAFED